MSWILVFSTEADTISADTDFARCIVWSACLTKQSLETSQAKFFKRTSRRQAVHSFAGSICIMKRNRHFVVPESHFKLLQGQDKLTLYQVNSSSAHSSQPLTLTSQRSMWHASELIHLTGMMMRPQLCVVQLVQQCSLLVKRQWLDHLAMYSSNPVSPELQMHIKSDCRQNAQQPKIYTAASLRLCGLSLDPINCSLYCVLQFNTRVAKHLFCNICGICSYYIPRSNPDGVAVTVTCLDDHEILDVQVQSCDGQNWEKNVGESLRDMSKPCDKTGVWMYYAWLRFCLNPAD